MASLRCLYCLLWTYFTPCSSISIVNFEHIITWAIAQSANLYSCSLKDVLKKCRKFTGKDLCWSLFLIKLQVFERLSLSYLEDLVLTIALHRVCLLHVNTLDERNIRKESWWKELMKLTKGILIWLFFIFNNIPLLWSLHDCKLCLNNHS